jgi:hypothetical protein
VSNSAQRFEALGVAGLLLATSLAFAALAQAGVLIKPDAESGFVIENNTGTIERLRIDEATGNISRNGALFVHTTGPNSTFVGEAAGYTATTSSNNSAFGGLALSSITWGGNDNSAFGQAALRNNVSGDNNSAFGRGALYTNSAGGWNSAFGLHALRLNTTSNSNSAFGSRALFSNTTGNFNSAFGRYALHKNTTADRNAAFGYSALRDNQTGIGNAAFGRNALRAGNGSRNSAFGEAALRNNTSSNNSAFGTGALYRNEGGHSNAAFGQVALRNNVSGSNNSAFGLGALYVNSTGYWNAALGREALRNATGGHNTAIGDQAGFDLTSGNFNIYINNPGRATESGKIRIGGPNQTETFIFGMTGFLENGEDVYINSDHELHTGVSSIRFKEAVRDMGETSELLMKLRPVTFRYREAVANGEAIDEYGLIAEEVAQVAPELVVLDAEGDPYSVRYHILPSLLVNLNQKQQRTIEERQQVIEVLSDRLDSIEQLLAAGSER